MKVYLDRDEWYVFMLSQTEKMWREKIDIPLSLYVRYKRAERDYLKVQDEIDELYEKRKNVRN